MSLRPAIPSFEKTAGIPYTKDTELICRIPSLRFSPTRLGLLTLSTCVGSGYEYGRSILTKFSRNPGYSQILLMEDYSWFLPVLTITVLPGIIHLNRATTLLDLPRTVDCKALSYLVYFHSTGILTSSPFDESC